MTVFKNQLFQFLCQHPNLLALIAEVNTLSETAKFIIKNQNTSARTVKDSLYKIQLIKLLTKRPDELIERLLLEKIPLAGIARSARVSMTWLQEYVNNKYAQVPQQVNVSAKKRGKLTLECDEAWSFVGRKSNKQCIGLALDKKTREIVGVYIGNRGEDGEYRIMEFSTTSLSSMYCLLY